MYHLDLMGARNWFQIPNTYDQPNQDQRQKAITYDLAPSYQHVFSPTTDNLFHSGSDKARTALRLSVLNLTNNVALYNFLSTFSGTHFVAPRTYQAEIKLIF
jgi:hypothetical protein